MAEEGNLGKRPVAEAISAVVTIVLTILGLAQVAPNFLVAIATIAFGSALLLRGSATIAEYARLQVTSSPAIPVGGSGLTAILLAGAAGVVLGILALLRINTLELTAIAVIAFGSALILSSSSPLRMHLYRQAARPDERASTLGAETLAAEMLSSAIGIYGLTGLAAIVLGILALAGFSPVYLVLIALLALGSVSLINAVDFSAIIVSAMTRA